MAVASLVSRITGFLRQLALVAVLGLGVVNDSYTVANTLPNIVYELLLGGVLTSVMVPLLIRAQTEDADGGEAYTRRLLTMAGAALAVATLVAMATAALLTRLYLGGSGSAHAQLATAFAWLLLPQIFFYGVGAMLGALLNTRGVFGPVRLGSGAQQRRRARRAGGLRRRARRDQPGARPVERPEAAGPRDRHDARHRRPGADPDPVGAPHRLPLPAAVGLGPAPLRDRRPRRLGRRVRPDRAGRLHRDHPRGRRRRAGQRRDLRQRLAAAPGALRRPRRLAADRADAAHEPGGRRGTDHRRRRRPRTGHAAVRGRVAARQRTADAVRHAARRGPVLLRRGIGRRGLDPAGCHPRRVRVRPAAVRGDDVAGSACSTRSRTAARPRCCSW